jgi:hypothetical protein
MQDTSQPQPDPVVIRADHDEVDERRESWERP